MRKSDKHTKHCLDLLTQKFILYNTSWQSLRREKQCMKRESITLARLREIKCHEKRERADSDLDIIFLVFGCSTCLLTGSVSTTLQWVWYPFVELTPKWLSSFLAIFTSSQLVPNSPFSFFFILRPLLQFFH